MLTSLHGVYENGAVHLTEPAPVTSAPVEVVVVFLDSSDQRPFVKVTETALELPQTAPRPEHMTRLRAAWQRARDLAVGMTGPTLSEEVMAERLEGN